MLLFVHCCSYYCLGLGALFLSFVVLSLKKEHLRPESCTQIMSWLLVVLRDICSLLFSTLAITELQLLQTVISNNTAIGIDLLLQKKFLPQQRICKFLSKGFWNLRDFFLNISGSVNPLLHLIALAFMRLHFIIKFPCNARSNWLKQRSYPLSKAYAKAVFG